MTDEQHEAPPLGIKPRWLVAEQRLRAIMEAMDRYNKAGVAIPSEWREEEHDLCVFLNEHRGGASELDVTHHGDTNRRFLNTETGEIRDGEPLASMGGDS